MSGAATETTADPDAWALADRLVLAQVEAQVLGRPDEPTTLGRYRIERGLGAGAMGRLLLAFDPDLRRSVALKLITPAQAHSPEARARIVREARAMARLSDPHVAQVYEVGEADGQLFVAMEYVDGQDARRWLEAGERTWPEVLEVFRQAGAGLAAAHDRGIVHRDFKPDNVMIEQDGRARVIDFGLAFPGRASDVDEPGYAPDDAAVSPVELTRTGAVVGTPAYIAPEQWSGGSADARSDQFSFCVALFEALAGRRPFPGDNEEEIRAALRREAVSWPRALPGFVRRALRRGLDLDPEARWPDMRSLVRALDPGRRRRRWLMAGVGGVLVAAVGLAARPADDPCRDADAALDEVWGHSQREAIEQAGTQVGTKWGEITGARLIDALDEHAGAWRTAARSTCAAARAEDRAEDAAATGCLQEARLRLREAVEQATTAEPSLWVSAVARAELLPDPRACAEAPAAVFEHGPPAATRTREGLVALERSLGESSVAPRSIRFADARAAARAQAEVVITNADADEYAPLRARAYWLAGRVRLGEGEAKAAERDLRRALVMARHAGDAPLAAAAVTELVYAVSRDRDRIREAEDLAEEAAGMLAALGDPPLLRARLLSHRASALAHARTGDHEGAVRLHEDALALLTEALGSRHPAVIVATGNLGAALNYASRPVDAEVRLREAIEAARAVWGEYHPRHALLVGTLGLSRMRQGDLEGARRHLRRSLELREAALGSDHVQVDDARYNLASALRRADLHAEALPLLEQGLAHTLARLGPEDARLGPWWVATGESSLEQGDHARAREALAAALRLFERTGASAADYARVRYALARAWADADPERAHLFAERALLDATEAEAPQRRAEIEAFLAAASPS